MPTNILILNPIKKHTLPQRKVGIDIMKKNRLQRLKDDMDRDFQKYAEEDLLETPQKHKKESNFLVKCVALCLLCSFGIAQFLGRVLEDKQAIVQYGLMFFIVICVLTFYIWLRRKYR